MLRLIPGLKCPALLSALSRAFKVIVGPLWRLFRLAWAAGSVCIASYVLHPSSPLYYTHLLQPSIPFVLVRAYSLWWLPTFLHFIATSTSALMYCLGATLLVAPYLSRLLWLHTSALLICHGPPRPLMVPRGEASRGEEGWGTDR